MQTIEENLSVLRATRAIWEQYAEALLAVAQAAALMVPAEWSVRGWEGYLVFGEYRARLRAALRRVEKQRPIGVALEVVLPQAGATEELAIGQQISIWRNRAALLEPVERAARAALGSMRGAGHGWSGISAGPYHALQSALDRLQHQQNGGALDPRPETERQG